MSRNNGNQIRTAEILASLTLLFVCVNFALNIIFKEIKRTGRHGTQSQMKVLFDQLSYIEPVDEGNPVYRKIASIDPDPLSQRASKGLGTAPLIRGDGEIGSDFWGKPFQYRYIRGTQGRFEAIVLLSAGGNSKFETKISEITVNLDKLGFVRLVGDDLGYIKKINANNK